MPGGPPTSRAFATPSSCSTERGLYRIAGAAVDGAAGVDAQDGVADASPRRRSHACSTARTADAPPKDKKSPFEVSDFFCVAPLAVFENELYAGGQRGGAPLPPHGWYVMRIAGTASPPLMALVPVNGCTGAAAWA